MRESDVQIKFNHYVKARWTQGRSAAFELKICKENSIPFSNVQEHQVAGLLSAKEAKLVYKIPDGTLGQKPFDSMCLSGIEAYVVIIWHYDRKYTRAYLIDIHDWVQEDETSERRSITEERASQLAKHVFEL